MMNIKLIAIVILTSFAAHAERYVDILPLQLQYRYEDSASQSKEIIVYQSYGLAIQLNQYRLGLENSQNGSRTDSGNLSITTDTTEYSLSGGYLIFEISAPEKKRSLNIFTSLLLGTTQTKVNTQLLGSPPTTAGSDKNMVLGVGITLVGRLKYFLLETEFKIINSKNFSPQTLPAAAIKIGASIPY